MKIYIVIGERGEYSDHQEWIVCAYKKRADAEDHAVFAEREIRVAITKHGSEFELRFGNEANIGMLNKNYFRHDPEAINEYCYYLGDLEKTIYTVKETELYGN